MSGKWLADTIHFKVPVPDDLKSEGIIAKTTAFYDPYEAKDRQTLQDLTNNQALAYILKNTDIDILLRTLGNAFFPRSLTIGTLPTEIITPNRYPRGYILINPNTTVSSVVTQATVFTSQVFPVGTTTSAAFNVGGFGGAAFFLDVTEASAGPVSVNLQTQDQLTGNWATAQSDIFGGASAVGTFYANVGGLGIDTFFRLQVVVAGDSMTASISATLKPALSGTIAGPSIFLGGPDVNTTIGFPLLGGQERTIYMKENTALFGVASAATNLRLFELQ